jgi:hypothetical protein
VLPPPGFQKAAPGACTLVEAALRSYNEAEEITDIESTDIAATRLARDRSSC